MKQKQIASDIELTGLALAEAGGEVKNYKRTGGHWLVAMGNGAWARVGDPPTVKALEALAKVRVQGGKVQVAETSKGDVAVVTKNELEFKAIAQEIIELTLKTGEKYFKLVKFIREKQISPRDSSKWLYDLGFHKTRISEIRRIAQAGDEVFNALEARMIGWRGALELSRGEAIDEMKRAKVVTEDKELEAALSEARESITAELEAETSGGDAAEKSAEDKAADKKAVARANMNKAAVRLLALAELVGVKSPLRWNNGSGFEVIVKAARKGKVPAGSQTRPEPENQDEE